mmetsp:Transcript_16755/g.25374  ORF Transcript_16755/g.25374 Transcript_16755/m.25374 type:complete len:217 (+) Transcript_16755:522-1172(+)
MGACGPLRETRAVQHGRRLRQPAGAEDPEPGHGLHPVHRREPGRVRRGPQPGDLHRAAGQGPEGRHPRADEERGDCLRAGVGHRHGADRHAGDRPEGARVHPGVDRGQVRQGGGRRGAHPVRRLGHARDGGRAHGPAGHRRRAGGRRLARRGEVRAHHELQDRGGQRLGSLPCGWGRRGGRGGGGAHRLSRVRALRVMMMSLSPGWSTGWGTCRFA